MSWRQEIITESRVHEKLHAQLKDVTVSFVGIAEAIAKMHGEVTTESDGFDGPFNTPLTRVNITTHGVPDNFGQNLFRLRIQEDYLRELTPEEQHQQAKHEEEAKREHFPPYLVDQPTKDEKGLLYKKGYLIESSQDGYKWSIIYIIPTFKFGKRVKLYEDDVNHQNELVEAERGHVSIDGKSYEWGTLEVVKKGGDPVKLEAELKERKNASDALKKIGKGLDRQAKLKSRRSPKLLSNPEEKI